MRIVNFGSLNIDYVYSVDHFVQPGETLSADIMQIYPGGKGLNQSIAVARAGGDIHHAGRYGADGTFLMELLKENGVDTNCLEKMDASNGHAIIQVDQHGENSILLYGGTNEMVDEAFIDRTIESVQSDDIVLFQNEVSSIGYAMKKAKEKGCKIALNPAPMNQKVLGYPLELVDILVVNETEGEALSGEKEVDAILNALKKAYPHTKVILTLGSKGAWFAFGDERFFVKACKVDKVVDTTAAGDTFIGYYLACISKGVDDKEALETATKAAAITVSRKGAAVSVPTMDELK